MKKIILLVVLAILILTIGACNLNDNKGPIVDEKEVEIESIGYIIKNIDRGFRTNGFTAASIFIDFYIYYNGYISSADSILSIRIENEEEEYWDFGSSELRFSPEANLIDLYQIFISTTEQPGNRIALGDYNFTLTLTNGKTATATRTVHEPGKSNKGGYSFVYTEDYSGSITGGTAMLERAVITSPVNNDATITMNFTCGNLAHNGLILFYNADNNSIGNSTSFIDLQAGKNAPFLNNGEGFGFNYSATNSISITSANIDFDSGYDMNDIAKFAVVLSDGKQYPNSYAFDCLSYTAKISF